MQMPMGSPGGGPKPPMGGPPKPGGPMGGPPKPPMGGPGGPGGPMGGPKPPGGPVQPWSMEDVDQYQPGLSPEQKQRWLQIANESRTSCVEGGGEAAQCDAMAVQIASRQVAPEKPMNAPQGPPQGPMGGPPKPPMGGPMGAPKPGGPPAPGGAPSRMGAPIPGRPPRAGM